MVFNILNEQNLKPSCFHTAAYEANFYWTIFGEESNAIALESYKKALDICNKWLSYAKTVQNGLSFTVFLGVQELPVIISNRWAVIFDNYIQIVLGLLSLIKGITYRRCNSYYKPFTASNDLSVLVHVNPIDFLGYIRYQCQVHLKRFFLLDDSFTSEMQNNITRMFLYTAARISTDTSRWSFNFHNLWMFLATDCDCLNLFIHWADYGPKWHLWVTEDRRNVRILVTSVGLFVDINLLLYRFYDARLRLNLYNVWL